MKKLWSIFTDDMDTCYFTGRKDVERHHCLGGFNRTRSEEYGFVIPLSSSLHPNGVHADNEMIALCTGYKDWKELDTALKKTCERQYVRKKMDAEDITREQAIEQFISEFGRNYLD